MSEARRQIAGIVRRAGTSAFAVGGGVRDALLGREPHDWDVVAADALHLARAVREALGGAFVWLHDRPNTCRVVVGAHGGQLDREEFDFADFRGPTLEADLRARDFTINSLAWPLGEGDEAVVDPCGGLADLHAGVLRANSREAPAEDPVRCLRVHRLAATLGFDVAPQTSEWIAEAAGGLAAVAPERVGAEFFRLMAEPRTSFWLREMDRCGTLAQVMPELLELKGVYQGGYHHLDVWGHTLLVLDGIESIAAESQGSFPRSGRFVSDYLAQPGRIARLKLAGLLHDIGKPATRTIQDGNVRFLGHAELGASMSVQIASRLRFTRETRAALAALTQWHMRPIMLVDGDPSREPSPGAIRRLVRDADPEGMGLIVLAAADLMACKGPATEPADQQRRLTMLDRIIAVYQASMAEQGPEHLIQGRDLITELGWEPGPHFSGILDAVEEAHLDGVITTRAEALALAARLLADGTQDKPVE